MKRNKLNLPGSPNNVLLYKRKNIFISVLPIHELLSRLDDVVVVLVIVAVVVQLPLLLPVLAALLVLGLLRPPLLLGVVNLVDVFVSLDQVHGQLPQRRRARVAVARLVARGGPAHARHLAAGARVVEAEHVGGEEVAVPGLGDRGHAAQRGHQRPAVLHRQGEQPAPAVLAGRAPEAAERALVLRLGEGRADVGWRLGAEVHQLLVPHEAAVEVRQGRGGARARAGGDVERRELGAGEGHGPLHDELGAGVGVGVPARRHVLDDHAAGGHTRQFLHVFAIITGK